MNPSDLQDDLLQHNPIASSPSPLEELQAQYQSLRSLLVAMLIALILLSLGVILFIGKQMFTVSAQLEIESPESRIRLADFKSKSEPLVRNFVGSLQVFATTNRDFQPILERYRTALFPYFAAPASAAPSPQAPPAPAPPTTPK